jgi:hypothetical protein
MAFVSFARLVDSVYRVCQDKVSPVFHIPWGDIIVVMPPLSMVTETVEVLYSQVKTLKN